MNASIRHLAQPALDRQVCRLPIDDQAVLRKSTFTRKELFGWLG
jgi:hypothetical protein